MAAGSEPELPGQPGVTVTQPELRPASRILLIDEQDRLLLFRAIPRSALGGSFWFPSGGGLQPDETHEQAALRELREETGIEAPLGPCVWTRRHVFPFLDNTYDQRERYYVVRVPLTEISTDGWEDLERTFMEKGRWWSLGEIVASDEVFVPGRLAELLPAILAKEYPAEPLDCGV
jgi:8-oxo-dGTP pyrophosphatase MutT (NUDIX family)